jgi:hypothetical protein
LVVALNFSLWLPIEESSRVQDWVNVGRIVDVRGGEASPISSGPTDVTLAREQLEGLPLVNGRTVQAALALVPGVVVTENNGNLAQFTGVGQRRFSNRLTIDGFHADLAVDALGPGIGQAGSGALPVVSTLGGTQVLVPQDAIEVFRVQTVGVSPEQRSTPGVQTSILTRSGTDRPTSSVFGQWRPDALAARDFFENAGQIPSRKADMEIVGASLGGPLVRGRLFGFGVGEGQWIDRPVTTTIRAPTQAARDGASPLARELLSAYPVANGRDVGSGLGEYTHEFASRSRLSSVSLRLDGNVSSRDRVFVRVQKGASQGDGINGIFPAMTFKNTEATSTTIATSGWSRVFTTWTQDLRANLTRNVGRTIATQADGLGTGPLPTELFLPSAASEQDVSIRVSLFPGSNGSLLFAGPLNRAGQQQLAASDSVGWIHGGHEIRAGIELQRVSAESTPPPIVLTYAFAGVSDLNQGRVRQVIIQRQSPARADRVSWSGYAQDAWRISPRLSLDVGVRYSVRPAPEAVGTLRPELVEYDSLPAAIPRLADEPLWKTAWANLAPQVAGAYQLRQSSDWGTRLRGSWGLAFDELSAPGGVPFGRGEAYSSASFLGGTAFPLPPGALGNAIPLASANDRFAIASDLRTPRTYDWQLAVDQALGRTQRLGIAYVGTAGRNLVYWSGYNIAVAPIYGYSSDGRSDYDALLVEYVTRGSRGLQGRVAYTWSHAIDNDSGEDVEQNLPTRLAPAPENRGSADFDRRHLLHVNASYQLPSFDPSWLGGAAAGWQVAVVGTVQSGAPINVVAPVNSQIGLVFLRPNLAPGLPVWIADKTVPSGRRLNPAAFLVPTGVQQGTLGRNSLRASALRQVDVACSKGWTARGVRVELRLDVFNVLNAANFGGPENHIGDLNFGRPLRSYADSLGTGTLARGGLTPMQQAGGPRAIQLSVKLRR